MTEADFLVAVLQAGPSRTVAPLVSAAVEEGTPRDRLIYWLDKWTNRGWYGRFAGGYSTDGTLTRAGVEKAAAVMRGEDSIPNLELVPDDV